MRRDQKSKRVTAGRDDQGIVHRSRVLQPVEQLSTRNADYPAAAIEFLIVFVRHLIRKNPSQDLLMLSIWSAASELGVDRKQAEKIIKVVMSEAAQTSWPPGFF